MLVLKFFFVNIENKGGVGDSGGVGTNSKVSNILNAWVVVFESTIKLCMGGELGEEMYGDE
jgi:hypothetical protein